MIDFPNSPNVGDLYVASNGVTYQWNGTLWLTSSAGGAGAVQAAGGTFTPATGADAVINFPTIVSGNTGNWLNLVNGRYTPPAGRYFLQCTNGVQAPVGGNGTWALVPRKNGVRIPNEGANASGGPQFSIPITVGIYVDANGTDYFDWVANCASPSMAAQGGQFTAFPLSGLQGPPGPLPTVGGDFCAYSANVGLATGFAVAIPTTILSGNSGNWYNPTNGRYTPPPGRYFIRASMYAVNTSSAVGLNVQIRKNGAPIPSAWNSGTGSGAGAGQVPGAAGWWGDPAQVVIVDANGTDYFDFTTYCGTGQYCLIQFMAFPITGVQGLKGPPGDPGQLGWRQLQRIVPLAGQATVDFTNLPADINDLMLLFDVTPANNDVNFGLQFFDAGGAIVATNYSWSNNKTNDVNPLNSGATNSNAASAGISTMAVLNYVDATGNRIGNVTANPNAGISGDLTIPNIRDAARAKVFNYRARYINTANTATCGVVGNGQHTPAAAISGVRLLFGAGNFAAGGAITLSGSP